MNQLDSLTITNQLNSLGSMQANFVSISDVNITNTVYLGSHAFKPQQLGDLLTLLLSLHPELSI
jgi:hypothetical protein